MQPIVSSVAGLWFSVPGKSNSNRLENLFEAGGFVAGVGLAIPLILIAFPIQSPDVIAKNGQQLKDLGLLRWEDGKNHQLPQDFADMLGWRDIAFLVDEAYDKVRDKKHTMVLCDNYGQAGAVNYYSVNKGIMQFLLMRITSTGCDWIGLLKCDFSNRGG
jgi:hypothetical protein